jgi:hypothetical protein
MASIPKILCDVFIMDDCKHNGGFSHSSPPSDRDVFIFGALTVQDVFDQAGNEFIPPIEY